MRSHSEFRTPNSEFPGFCSFSSQSFPSPALAEDRLKNVAHRGHGQRAAILRRDMAQHEAFARGVAHRPFAAMLDPADGQRKAIPLVDEIQQPPIQPVNSTAQRLQALAAVQRIVRGVRAFGHQAR